MNTETKKFGLKTGLRGNTTLVIERVDDGEVSSTITVSLNQDDFENLRETLCGKKDYMPILNRIAGIEKAFDAHTANNTEDFGVLAQSIKDLEDLDKVIPELGNVVAACNAKMVGLAASVGNIKAWMDKTRG